MSNTPISGFTSGAPAQSGDEFVIARSGANYKLTTANLATYMTTGLTSLTLGTQSTSQGSLILSNTNVGAFPTTLQSSNSASAAWTMTLPVTAGSNGFILTTNGSGVTSWTNPTALGIDLDVGTTAITGGTTGRILYNNSGVLGEYAVGTGVATALGNNTNSANGLAVLNASGILNVAQGGTGLTSLTAGYIPFGNGTGAFGSSADLFWDSANGRLGIGTTSPTQRLSISSGATPRISLTDTRASVDMQILADNVAGYSGTTTNYPYVFVTNNAERMRIDSAGRIGIGTTPNAIVGLTIGRTITGGTVAFSTYLDQTVSSDVTAVARGIATNIGTAAASFTCGNLQHMYVTQGTLGAGSSVSNQFGYYAESSLTGATNNYAFYSNIASGTGRWNFFAAGTANNYFAGNVGIGTTAPGAKLETYVATNPGTFQILSVVTNDTPGSGVAAIGFNVSSSALGEASSTKAGIGMQRSAANGGGALIFYNNNSTSAGSFTSSDERMRIDSSGNVGIGTSSPSAKLHINTTSANAFRLSYDASNYLVSYVQSNGGVIFSQTASSERSINFQTNSLVASSSTYCTFTSKSTSDTAAISPFFVMSKWGSTSAATPNNSSIGALIFDGISTSITYARLASISCEIGTNSATGAPAWLTFNTSDGTTSDVLERMRIDSSGNVLVTGVGGLGYGTGSGGAVTQATSRTTGVTLDKTNGAITLVSAAGSATYQSFTVTNNKVAATDTIIVNQKSGTDKYILLVTAVSAGSFQITFATTGGTTTEQPVFNFAVIKAVTA